MLIGVDGSVVTRGSNALTRMARRAAPPVSPQEGGRVKALVLGLDGADYDLVRDLLAKGTLPTIGAPRRARALSGRSARRFPPSRRPRGRPS